MANYDDPDEFFDKSQVDFGVGTGKESIRASLKSTNGAAHSTWSLVKDLATKVADLPTKVADLILTGTWFEYKNQDDVPAEKRGKDNVIGSLNATNGRVFHPTFGLKALSDRLDAIEAKIDKLAGPGN
jgi:hypothetical protein